MIRPALFEELEKLSSRERLELAYGLIESVLHDATAPGLSDPQRRELHARLAQHRAHPEEGVASLDEIRRRSTEG
jgi:putative addiction module component (TIGR02574 family)